VTSGVHFVASDGNGNVRVLVTAATGTVSAQYEYAPFGEMIRLSGSVAAANPIRFSTKYQDDETDLLYYGFRFYNPNTGRWLLRDPIEEMGGQNIYGFCQNSSVNYVDSLGLGFNVPTLEVPLTIIAGYSEDDDKALGFTTSTIDPEEGGGDNIQSVSSGSCGCYCAEAKGGKTFDLTGMSLIPKDPDGVGTRFTENGRQAVIGHEARRVASMEKGWKYILSPSQGQGEYVTRCGVVCMQQSGAAKTALGKYLTALRAAALDAYRSYNISQQVGITMEIGHEIKDSRGLFDGIDPLYIWTVKQPSFSPPDCPKSDCKQNN
jgi:RHS repeat-associated protein